MSKKRVKAIAVGYHGILREPGTDTAIFEIDKDEELGDWMVEVDKDGKPKGKLDDLTEEQQAAAKQPAGSAEPIAPVSPQQAAATSTVAPKLSTPAPAKVYKAKHNGGGNYIVVDENDLQVGDTFKKDDKDASKAKADAQAKAEELNAKSKPTDDSPNFDQQQLPDA